MIKKRRIKRIRASACFLFGIADANARGVAARVNNRLSATSLFNAFVGPQSWRVLSVFSVFAGPDMIFGRQAKRST